MQRNYKALAASLLAILTAAAPQHAAAQLGSGVVVCTNCSNISTQLLEYAGMAEDAISQASQLQQQIQSYANMVHNTLSLPARVIGDIRQDINRVRDVYNQARGLAYTVADMDNAFAERYRDFDTYVEAGVSSEGYRQQQRKWAYDTRDGALRAMKALKAHNEGIEKDLERLNQLQTSKDGADGQKQALDVANDLAMEAVQQSIKTREVIMLLAQLESNKLASETDQRNADLARLLDFTKPPEYQTNDARRW